MSADAPHAASASNTPGGKLTYPTHHLVAVLDTAEQVADAVQTLAASDFSLSEILVGCGTGAADALAATTGRRGLVGLAVRVAEAIGYQNFEMRVKAVVEQALRDGHYVVLVPAREPDRRDEAVRILASHGAHSVTYHDRLTVEAIVPPNP